MFDPAKDYITESVCVRAEDVRSIRTSFEPIEDVNYQGIDTVKGNFHIDLEMTNDEWYGAFHGVGTHYDMRAKVTSLQADIIRGGFLILATMSNDTVVTNPEYKVYA